MSAVRLPPPITAASAVDGALRERGHAVLDAAGLRTSLGVAGGALDTWPAYWHRLPPDTQLRDGGRYRQRRHGSFVVEGDGVRAVPHRAKRPEGRMGPMSASWLIVIASLLFATMGVCVKLASPYYGSGEIVMYRGLVGALMIGAMSRWRGDSLRTTVPAQHFVRSLTGVTALCLWFYAIGKLPLATAMTLNYTSSLWIALFLVGGASVLGTKPVDGRLVFAALLGFTGVVLVLRPTIEQEQLWYGLVGLLSGMVSATGYLQVTALGRAGETESRVVFYFSIGGVLGGAALSTLTGWHAHSWSGVGLLLAVGVLATVAQLMLTRAYARGRTLVNASLQYLGIGFAFLYGVLLFDDRVTWIAVVGMLLIVGAGVRATMLRAPADPARSQPQAKP